MKPEHREYFLSLGMTNVLLDRVQTIYGFYENVCPENITNVFISEYINEDGSREYISLWLFSETFVMEAKQFVTQDKFDMASYRNVMNYWEIFKHDYDFGNGTDKSRLTLKASTTAHTSFELKASKENCNHLKNVLMNIIIPNMKT